MRSMLLRSSLFVLALLALPVFSLARENTFPQVGLVPRNGGFQMENYWVWDGSVVKHDDGKYYMFASRFHKDVTFHPGWMVYSEVVLAVSDTLTGPYAFVQVVLPPRGAQYWDGRATHNPTIRKHGDTYVLFYMGSTHPLSDPPRGQPLSLQDPRCIVARANKRVGIATAKDPRGPWTRLDRPVLEVQPDTFYSFLTSNPTPVIHGDGAVTMIFKSRRYNGNVHSGMMLGLAKAKHYAGPYQVIGDEPLFGPDKFGEVEDPFLWQTAQGFELIAKDMTGAISGEKHSAIHATSPDCVTWTLSEPAKAYSRTITWDDGATQTMGQLERPFVYFEDGQPVCLFAAAADGPGGFNNATKSWVMAMPLVKK